MIGRHLSASILRRNGVAPHAPDDATVDGPSDDGSDLDREAALVAALDRAAHQERVASSALVRQRRLLDTCGELTAEAAVLRQALEAVMGADHHTGPWDELCAHCLARKKAQRALEYGAADDLLARLRRLEDLAEVARSYVVMVPANVTAELRERAWRRLQVAVSHLDIAARAKK